MPKIRDILNKLKWTDLLADVEICYIHRGAVNNMKIITGSEIIAIGSSFLETASATIPYHRITKIKLGDTTLFDRYTLRQNDKQI